MTLEQAKRLKAAGYPQGKTIRYYDDYGDGDWLAMIDEQYGRRIVDGIEVAAPNSDELLAEIQRRWEGIHVMAAISRHRTSVLQHNLPCSDPHIISFADDDEDNAPCGATILDALVELYCKLAEEDDA